MFRPDPVRSFEYVLGNGIRNSLRPLFPRTKEGLAELEMQTDRLTIQIMKELSKNQDVRVTKVPVTFNNGQSQGCIIVTLAGHVTPLINMDDADQYYEHLKVLWEYPQWKMPPNLKTDEEIANNRR